MTWLRKRTILRPRRGIERARSEAALKVSAWLAANDRAMRQPVEKGVQAVTPEHCRTLLQAELDVVEQAKNDALPSLDAKAVQAATIPGLRMVQKVAARLVDEAPAMDRELMRVGQAIKAAGVPADLLARLRKLAEEKAKGFPTAREAQALEGAMDAFAKQLGELAKAAASQARAPAGAH